VGLRSMLTRQLMWVCDRVCLTGVHAEERFGGKCGVLRCLLLKQIDNFQLRVCCRRAAHLPPIGFCIQLLLGSKYGRVLS